MVIGGAPQVRWTLDLCAGGGIRCFPVMELGWLVDSVTAGQVLWWFSGHQRLFWPPEFQQTTFLTAESTIFSLGGAVISGRPRADIGRRRNHERNLLNKAMRRTRRVPHLFYWLSIVWKKLYARCMFTAAFVGVPLGQLAKSTAIDSVFNPLDSYIWVELLGSPTDRDVYLFGSVIQAWYVMGRLGAFNSSNLQLANCSMEYNPLYDAEKAMKVMPSSFHDISDVEFQDNWGRFWVDLGTADVLAIDVLLNCLTVLSSEYLGIQQVVFGGRNMGDWEEGMISPEYGYKSFKI
ncbi:hypothetical protein Cgig2_001024 [Carnegiea gigantea]|uniref:Uncharacterized protein n=1 Tax=Carnegiea gigantea TaxID=171969 RepID=A0A9Q1GS95_9CARY|nr:hypothetical protein Cgig2_001024 [Carnegiea gigantea]